MAPNAEHDWQRLSREEASALHQKLNVVSTIELLNCPHKRVADLAAEELATRGASEPVSSAVIRGSFTKKKAKLRALYVLQVLGARDAESLRAYRLLAGDRDPDVVGSALFGIVFSRDKEALPGLRELLSGESKPALEFLYKRAIWSLSANMPHEFSPDFYDLNNVWGLRNY